MDQSRGAQQSRRAQDWASFNEPSFRPLYDAVHDRLGIGDGSRLLDVGCGPGGAAVLAAGRGARVAGLDAQPDAIEVARERVPDGDFQVGDMEALPWSDGSFHAVTGFNSFQFAQDRVAALAEARRVLAPGGKLGIAVWAPPAESQQPRVMGAIAALAPPLPPDAPSTFALSAPGVLESALEQAGLHPVDGGDMPIVSTYPDADAACRVLIGGSAGMRAVQAVGEERVRKVIVEAMEAFRAPGGSYRFENRFRFVIVE